MTEAVANATPESAVRPQLRDVHSSSPPPNWQRGFWALIVTQFQNAFNDNAIKFLVIYIIVAMNFPEDQRDFLVLVVGALFALPFIFFSMTGGYFADRYSKRSVVIGTKLMEIGVMAVAIAGLAMRSLPIECAAVFLISTQSALFGPSKYGLLPELLPEQKLSWGNGIIELGTFLGSISAVMAAGFLGGALSRTAGNVGRDSARMHADRAGHKFRNLARARPLIRRSAFVGIRSAICFRISRSIRADRSSQLGRGGQYLLVVSRGALAIHDRDLWARRAARR